MNYTIKRVSKQDFDLLIPLMKDAFGMNVDIEYFRWKFIDNPSGEFIGFVAISEDNECAAYYGVIPEQYLIHGVTRTVFQSCDTMTHSKHRRKGLFQLLAKHCYNHLHDEGKLFVIGFGGGQSTPGFIKFGWKELFKTHYHFRLSLQSYVAYWFNKINLNSTFTYKEVSQIDEIINLRGNANFSSDVIQHQFNKEFYSWRLKNPRKQYIKELIFQYDKVIGFLIYYLEDNKVFLFDYHLIDEKYGKSLTKRLDDICFNNKSKGIITLSQKDITFSNVLLRNGFFINTYNKGPLSEKIPFIFYAEEPELTIFNSESHWAITPIYHDAL